MGPLLTVPALQSSLKATAASMSRLVYRNLWVAEDCVGWVTEGGLKRELEASQLWAGAGPTVGLFV